MASKNTYSSDGLGRYYQHFPIDDNDPLSDFLCCPTADVDPKLEERLIEIESAQKQLAQKLKELKEEEGILRAQLKQIGVWAQKLKEEEGILMAKLKHNETDQHRYCEEEKENEEERLQIEQQKRRQEDDDGSIDAICMLLDI